MHTDTAVSSSTAADVHNIFCDCYRATFLPNFGISIYLMTRIRMKVTTTCSHKVSNGQRTCTNLIEITVSEMHINNTLRY